MLNNTSIQLCIRKRNAKSTCKRINIASPGWSSFLLSLNRIILCRHRHVGNPLLSLENEQTQSHEISMQSKKKLIQTGFSRKIKTLASSIPKFDCFKEENLTSFSVVSVLRICGVFFFVIATRVSPPPPNFLLTLVRKKKS